MSASAVQPPLDDLGFRLVSRWDGMVYVSDGLGILAAALAAGMLFFGRVCERDAARHAIFFVSMGNLFSASLHTFTRMPSSEHAASSAPLMGGTTDKLMSNHTFNVGIVLIMLHRLQLIRGWLIPICTCVSMHDTSHL
uniref:Uncharacterized protein n=1 Tax=Haptolina brevifila TaxID=156173 RepID=A0A7S2FUT1_9EUKA